MQGERGLRLSWALTAILATLAFSALAGVPSSAAAAELPALFTRFPANPAAGAVAGKLKVPRALATDPRTGDLLVAESANRRISEFTPWGTFVKSFGGEVAAGPVNEVQEVRVRATGGQFRLSFAGATTPDLEFDASGAAVEAALDALPSIGAAGGSVTVAASPGNQVVGVTPTVFTVTFSGGTLAGADIAPLVVEQGATPLSGGEPTSSLEVITQVNGDATPNSGVCTTESGCRAGTEGFELGQLIEPSGVTVDQSGDVYVMDPANARVEKFSPEGEPLLLFGGEVDKTTGADVCTVASGDECGAGVEGSGPGFFERTRSSLGQPQGVGNYIDVGADGTVFVGDHNRIQEFDADGAYKGEIDLADLHAENPTVPAEGYVTALAVDPVSEALYFALYERERLGETPKAFRVNPSNGPESVTVIDGATAGAPEGAPIEALAVDPAGDLWVGLTIGESNGRVIEFNSLGEVEVGYNHSLAAPRSTSIELVALGTNSSGDLYVAENLGSPATSAVSAYGPPPLAIAPPPSVPPSIESQFATAVGSTSAALKAQINPHFFADTTYYVEYGVAGCEAGGCTSLPVSPGQQLTSQVSGGPLGTAPIHIGGLSPNTTYHYRFVAESGGGGPVKGLEGQVGAAGEGTFTTLPLPGTQPTCSANEEFRPEPAAFLPDCRAYEMVSPVEKNGSDISVLFNNSQFPSSIDQSAEDGDALTYSAYRAFGDAQSAPYAVQYLARRDVNQGWVTTSVSPSRQGPPASATPSLNNEYQLFTSDLCRGVLFHDTADPLAAGAVPGFRSLYRGNLCAGGFELVAPQTEPVGVEGKLYSLEVQGASADASRVFIASKGALAAGGKEGVEQLYEVNGAETTLVCVLPSNKPVTGACSAGTRDPNTPEYDSDYEGAVSADGAEVYWTDESTGRIYLRLSGLSTLPVSAGSAQFWGASSDGSQAIYSEGEKLRMFSLDAGTSTTVATGFRGLLGMSSDASKLYFVSTEDLASGATAGEPNLYLYEAGEPGTFNYVSTLASADVTEEGVPFPASPKRHGHTAQVSSDGGTLVFMSAGRPTGFDNADAENGEPDTEVYLYRAGKHSLSCISCARGGARPIGRDGTKEWHTRRSFWVAGQIPPGESALRIPRVVSQGGTRVFFESYDALSERDTNEQKDVYEWEAEGVGNCSSGVAGYDPGVEGCINLISSGESPQPSSIVDTDPTGRDVFFKTEASLLPQDTEAVDIYDAREGGGFPLQPPVAESCQGEACRPTGPSSSSGTPSTPSSTQVQSSGDLLRPHCRKGTHLVTKGGKNQCVKAAKHHKKKAHKRKHHKKHSQAKKHRNASKARRAGR